MIYEDSIVSVEDEVYVICKNISEHIGLSRGQYHNEYKKIKNDPLLKNYCADIKVRTNGGLQNMVCINIKCLGIWLAGINRKSLKDQQYEVILTLLEFCLSDEFDKFKRPSKVYSFESELRDDLFNNGFIDNIKIIDKEVSYDFGRIDLLGLDQHGNNVCIEVKKYKEFTDTKEQLLKYKISNMFDKIIYLAYDIDTDFQNWCIDNDIIIYTYKRELIVNKLCNNEVCNFELIDNDIENLKFGLENFIEKEEFVLKLHHVSKYKKNLIEGFRKYINFAQEYKSMNDMSNFIKTCIILYYFKNCYVSDIEELVDITEEILEFDENEIVDLYADRFKNYLLGYGY